MTNISQTKIFKAFSAIKIMIFLFKGSQVSIGLGDVLATNIQAGATNHYIEPILTKIHDTIWCHQDTIDGSNFWGK